MDAHMQDQQQKDFLSSLFPMDMPLDLQNTVDGGQQQVPLYPFNNSPTSSILQQLSSSSSSPVEMGNQLNMNLLGNLMLMQPDGHPSSSTSPTQSRFNPQLLLEQQFKLQQLQQLQQLQNQIFQQQIALISGSRAPALGSATSPEPQRERRDSFHGLPTPGSSTELRAQQSVSEFVSPMILNYMDTPQEPFTGSIPSSMSNQYGPSHRGSTSAPAHIAFRTHLPDVDVDLDTISPITSPWLGADSGQPSGINNRQQSASNKRGPSPSGDEALQSSRKKHSPATCPMVDPSLAVTSTQSKRRSRPSKSTSSTPLMRSTRSRKGSTAEVDVVGDSPSPVDLSMPPPSSADTISPSISNFKADSDMRQLTPVTPAIIMKIGRLGMNSTNNVGNSNIASPAHTKSPATNGQQKPQTEGKGKQTRKNSTSNVSPSLKVILPAGGPPPTNQPPSNETSQQPVLQVRKTSHKAAEQKRRDSLKTTFDDLRGLLPPIPLPNDEREGDIPLLPARPLLPGALPPRGPPKAGGEGPNKGISKLQLLICGNEYIRLLKGRVERRDEEIGKLRREVTRLRQVVSMMQAQNLNDDSGAGALASLLYGEDLDLEKDLDEEEIASHAARTAKIAVAAGEDEDDGEE